MEIKWLSLVRSASPLLAETEKAPTVTPASEAVSTRPAPMLSVIIPAHNEEAYLGRTLESLQAQEYPRFEIIVVANGCSDRTALVAQQACDRLLVLPQRGISRARNLGARMAQGEILVFLDADTLLQPKALEIIAGQFTRDISAGTLRGIPDSPRLTFRLLYGLKNLMNASALHKGSIGVIICWKDHFSAVGGFDERLHVMENSVLIRKLDGLGKYRCLRGTAAVTSMRRYEKAGFWPTTRLWFKLWLRSHNGELHDRQYTPVR